MPRWIPILCHAVLVVGGCRAAGDRSGGSPDAGEADAASERGPAIAIEVLPTHSELQLVAHGESVEISLSAGALYADGSRADISDAVTWVLDNRAPGAFIDDGSWVSNNRAGGKITIEARHGNLSATADIHIQLQATVFDPASDLPADVESKFERSQSVQTAPASGAPGIVYPAHQVMLPRNLWGAAFHLEGDLDLYRLHFASDHIDMEVFTTSTQWRADVDAWAWLADSAAGGSVTMTASGIRADAPTLLYRSEPIQIFVSRFPVNGAVYRGAVDQAGVLKSTLSDAQWSLIDPPSAGEVAIQVSGAFARWHAHCHGA